MLDNNPKETFGYLVKGLSELNLGYLHVLEPITGYEIPDEIDSGQQQGALERLTPHFRGIFGGKLIANGGYLQAQANQALKEDQADLIAFGVPFLANPDLPEMFRQDAPLNEPDQDTFYQGEEKGYIDYPTLETVN